MKLNSSIYRDKFELCDQNGEVVKEIPFVVNVTATAQLVTTKQREMTEVDQNDPAAMGKAFIELLEAIFGSEVVQELVDYYASDYMTMVIDLAPLLTENIFPVFNNYRRSAIEARKKVKK